MAKTTNLRRRAFLQAVGASFAALVLPRPAFSAAENNLVALGKDRLITAPHDAVTLALDDARTLDDLSPFVRYVWVPDWFDRPMAFAKVSLVANSVLSRVTTLAKPVSLADGRLLRIDFLKLTSTVKEAEDLLALYEKLADRESYFHVRQNTLQALIDTQRDAVKSLQDGDRIEIKTADGRWLPGQKFSTKGEIIVVRFDTHRGFHDVHVSNVRALSKVQAQEVVAERLQAPYAQPDISELSDLLSTDVPIMRLDEWVTFTFNSNNRGLYYELAGIGDTLKDVLTTFAGKDAADKMDNSLRAQQRTGRVDPALAQSCSITTKSRVTGRQRMTVAFYAGNTNPLLGPQPIFVTLDIAEDNEDLLSDPFRNPLDFKRFDGGEAIWTMPNGMLGYYVFDKNLKRLADVPPNVAFNREAPDGHPDASTARVSSGLICARCHDKTDTNFGFQQVTNDALDINRLLGSLTDDLGRVEKQRALQELASKFQGDLDPILDSGRLTYQKQVHAATGKKTSREIAYALADDYWCYWYNSTTAVSFARDLGFNLNEDEAVSLLLAIPPASGGKASTLNEDIILGKIKDRSAVTSLQGRSIFSLIATRAAKAGVRGKLAEVLKEKKQ